LWSPGIRTGVQPGSWFHRTECFGPVLGVMAADDLDHAIELQNSTGYGLTGGIQSLDANEVRRWLAGVEVGNAYVNRHITGAIVRRQPFGGWKRSSVGPTAKAGGPGYVPALCRWEDTADDRCGHARRSYPEASARLSTATDVSGLHAEINALRHLPLPEVTVVVGANADDDDLELCRLAASTVGAAIRVCPPDDACGLPDPGGVRILGTVSLEVLQALHDRGATVDARRPTADGDVELRRWVREQAVSVTAHRYGRPLDRAEFGL
jgi:RHH-type proline utilization regulon transcriptional repressor/proline dehydrogenase/delta 1-pyrroline-5-carboxylate dehydrogenase